jgi:hypothetical protein
VKGSDGVLINKTVVVTEHINAVRVGGLRAADTPRGISPKPNITAPFTFHPPPLYKETLVKQTKKQW